MIQDPVGTTRRTVANILDYYGIGMIHSGSDSVDIDRPDLVACLSGKSDKPDIGIKVVGRRPRTSQLAGVLNLKSLKYVVYLAPKEIIDEVKDKLPATVSLLEKDVSVFPSPTAENVEFENMLRSITGKDNEKWFFEQMPAQEKHEEIPIDTQEMDRFEDTIQSQGLSALNAKRLVYQAAVGGLNIESGTRIGHSLGNMITRRNENLSKEAIFLEALGVLRENAPAPASQFPGESTIYLTLDQGEKTTALADQIIVETVSQRRDRISDILSSYPEQFIFIAIIGTLGIFAPKQQVPPERSTTYPTGVIRTTFESENTYLVETIRHLVNITGITTVEWNRVNTLASYHEIANLLQQFFERFEKIGIGVKGNRGVKRIYIPVTHIARSMDIASGSNSYNKMELKKYVVWDTVLNYKSYMHHWESRLNSLGITQEDISSALIATMKKGMTSGLLPEGSYMPFAVYKSHLFRNYCVERMREAASAILDITW